LRRRGSPKSTWTASAFLGIIISFFFQAEDGIRDTSVTGVQTCALPILRGAGLRPRAHSSVAAARAAVHGRNAHGRSEERRVGEECRSPWAPDHLKKKKSLQDLLARKAEFKNLDYNGTMNWRSA